MPEAPFFALGTARKERTAGFVVVPADHKQFYELYTKVVPAWIAPFVTTDAVLHTYHVLHLQALRRVGTNVLIGEARTLTRAMLDATRAVLESPDFDVAGGSMRAVVEGMAKLAPEDRAALAPAGCP